MLASHRFSAAIGFLLLLANCGGSDQDTPNDGGNEEAGPLFPCDTPGKPCNPHDKCAIDPICGEDLLCHPQGQQNCDDELACTEDKCLGAGKCEHEVLVGCALVDRQKKSIQCFEEGAINPDNPCEICDPGRDTVRWSPHSGLTCDDGDLCTADDRCKSGRCEGTRYSCSDARECTEDVCDGLGGCTNDLLDDWCLIAGGCYEDKTFDESGCNLCDVATSQTSWTVLENACAIGNRCFAEGARDPTGCGICDPDSDPSGWTAATDRCLIAGQCYEPGDPDTTGCGSCDPTQSTTAFTAAADKCLIGGLCVESGDKSASGCGVCLPDSDGSWWSLVASAVATVAGFDAGLGDWTVDSQAAGVGWQVDNHRFHRGNASLYYGNPATRSFDNSAANSGLARGPELSLPAGQHAALHFWAYLDVEASPMHDLLEVKISASTEQVLWSKTEETPLRRWFPVAVDLTDFAGQSVSIAFAFDSVDGWANGFEGVYIDDVSVITGCGTL